MHPGFGNFQLVRRGDVLATDARGPVRSPGSFRLFLPLYQGLGDDGFFLARPVDAVWLFVSRVLRRLGAPALAPLLPGVSRHPEVANTLLVDTRIARFLAPEVFHLLGYRVRRVEEGRLEAKRR
jgi:succinylglutamate desuccinylase